MQKIRTSTKIFILIIFIFTFLIFNNKGYLNPIKNSIANIFLIGSPKARGEAIDTRNFFTTLFSIKNILQENTKLKKIEIEKEIFQDENQKLKKENEQLRELLNLPQKEKYVLKNAEVIGQDPLDNNKYLILNKGEKDGIKKGMVVIYANKVLVGEIIETQDKISKLMLTSSPNNKFEAKIVKNDIIGAATGKYNTEISLELIPNEIEVNLDDLIITSPNANKYPKDLLVGKIASIGETEDGLHKDIKVKPFYSINDLKFVSIIVE